MAELWWCVACNDVRWQTVP